MLRSRTFPPHIHHGVPRIFLTAPPSYVAVAFRHDQGEKLLYYEKLAISSLVKAWHNPYTAKEEIVREKLLALQDLWSGNEYRREWQDLREEVIILKGTACHICGIELHSSEV